MIDEVDDMNSLINVMLKTEPNILSELYRRLDNSDFLERGGFSNEYYFIGSNLRIKIFCNNINRPKIRYLVPSNNASNHYIFTTFEEFFELCPDYIKEKILFNLDLFR